MNRQQRINHLHNRARSWRHRQYNGTYTVSRGVRKQAPVLTKRGIIEEILFAVGLLILGAILACSLVA